MVSVVAYVPQFQSRDRLQRRSIRHEGSGRACIPYVTGGQKTPNSVKWNKMNAILILLFSLVNQHSHNTEQECSGKQALHRKFNVTQK